MTEKVIPSTVSLVIQLARGFESSGHPELADELLEVLHDAILAEQAERYRRKFDRDEAARKDQGK